MYDLLPAVYFYYKMHIMMFSYTACSLNLYIGSPHELTRKAVSQMFYNGELEDEARNGHLRPDEMIVHLNSDKLEYMQYIVEKQCSSMYQHVPRKGCIERGMHA